MRLIPQTVWGSAFVVVIGVSAAVHAESPVPKRFAAVIGAPRGTCYRVELRRGALTYTSWIGKGVGNAKRETIRPTAAQWREFRHTLDDLNVWKWNSQYRTEGIMDGTSWELDIAYVNRELKTTGYMNYPDINGSPNGQPTEAFNRYLSAVQKLIGGKDF